MVRRRWKILTVASGCLFLSGVAHPFGHGVAFIFLLAIFIPFDHDVNNLDDDGFVLVFLLDFLLALLVLFLVVFLKRSVSTEVVL